jgi:hypothetical protein
MKIDIYKSVFLVILAVFVFCYYLDSQNGRFSFTYDLEGKYGLILDTKNGTTYLIDEDREDKKVVINSQPIIK